MSRMGILACRQGSRKALVSAILCLSGVLAFIAVASGTRIAQAGDSLLASGPRPEFGWADEKPTSTVDVPADGKCYTKLEVISGKASGDATEVLASIRDDEQYLVYAPQVFRTFSLKPKWYRAMGIPSNETVYSMAACPQGGEVVFAATKGGVYKSKDRGRSWQGPQLAGTTCYWVALDIVDEQCNTVYVGTDDHGLRKTTDGGKAWSQVAGVPPNLDVFVVAADPNASGKMYAGTSGQGIYQSAEPDEPWTALNDGLPPGTTVTALAVDGGDPQTIYAGTWGRNVYKHQGTGDWSAAKTGLLSPYIYALAIDPNNQEVLFAGTREKGVYRTENQGGKWTEFGLGERSVSSVLVTDSLIHAGVDGTADGKSVWQRQGKGDWSPMALQPGMEGQKLQVWNLAFDDPVLLAGTTDGVWWYGSP